MADGFLDRMYGKPNTPRRREVLGHVIICDPDHPCADPNVNRWYCMRLANGWCPVERCNEGEAKR